MLNTGEMIIIPYCILLLTSEKVRSTAQQTLGIRSLGLGVLAYTKRTN